MAPFVDSAASTVGSYSTQSAVRVRPSFRLNAAVPSLLDKVTLCYTAIVGQFRLQTAFIRPFVLHPSCNQLAFVVVSATHAITTGSHNHLSWPSQLNN